MKVVLTLEIEIDEEDWTLNYGIEGKRDIKNDVKEWAMHTITVSLENAGVEGFALRRN